MKLTLQKIVFIIIFFLSSEVRATGLFDFFTIYVFSDLQGIVTMKGEPVVGAQVTRVANHEEDKVYTDSTTTDAQANFSFDAMSTFSLRPIMLGTIIQQYGQDYVAWKAIKKYNHRYGELYDDEVVKPKKPNLMCELTDHEDDRKIIKMTYRQVSVYGLCKLSHYQKAS